MESSQALFIHEFFVIAVVLVPIFTFTLGIIAARAATGSGLEFEFSNAVCNANAS
jgi:hypothetical protein